MSDDLDRLRAGLRAAPPAPEAETRAAHLRLAMESFDRRQERPREERPSQDRPQGAGFLTGVRNMLSSPSRRPALAATASVAALCAGLVVVLPALDTSPLPPATPAAGDATVGQTAPQTTLAAPEADAGRMDGAAATSQQKAAEETTAAQPAEPAPPPVAETATADMAMSEALEGEAAPLPAPSAEARRLRAEAPPMAGAVANFAAPGAQSYGGAPAPADMIAAPILPDTEAFPEAGANPVKIVAEEPVSTFSIDVDTASWAVVRSSLTNGMLPPAGAVRIEEMVNYFPYAYPAPEAGEAPFRPSVSVIPTPWNEHTRLVHIGIQGRLPALEGRPPLNLVFLIDTSGSMQDANKLPLLKQSFRLLIGQLRPEDQVAIVTYAGSAGLALEPTPASDSAAILAALDRLEAGGSTAGQEGLQQAYAVAEGMTAEGEVSRILLATDGDFNVGIHDPEELKTFIEARRAGGAYLSVLGFGRGNLDDATMQALAQNGNGTAAYIDTLSEAQKVLVDQLSGALFPIADDVKIQMEFNPAVIAEYRLIGYETRALAREDFNNDKVDAGEIGAGHQVTALYEVTPVGSPAVLNDPLRYAAGEASPVQAEGAELGFLKLRYKEPGEAASRLIEMPVAPDPAAAGEDARFAAAVAGMGQLLTGAKYLGDWGWDEAIALANGAKGADPYGYRAEAVQLMRLAQSLSR